MLQKWQKIKKIAQARLYKKLFQADMIWIMLFKSIFSQTKLFSPPLLRIPYEVKKAWDSLKIEKEA